MPKVVGFYSKGRGRKRKVHPITESGGTKLPRNMTTRQKYRQAIKTQTRHSRTVNVPEGFRYSTSYPVGHDGLKKSVDYYEKKGLKTVVVREGKRDILFVEETRKIKPKPKKRAYGRYDSQRVFYEQCQKIAKEHPKWSVAKVEAEATITLSGIGEPTKTKEKRLLAKIEKISSVKGVAYAKDLELEEDVHGHVVGGKDFEALSSLLRKGDVYCPREGMYKPTKLKVKPKKKEIKPKPKPKPKKVKKHKIKPPKPRAKMTHIEKMHLLASAKQFNIDPQEIDNTLTYYENKKHIHEMARSKGVSEMEISSSERESKQWASQYQEYLGNLKGELEGAGYTVTSP